MNIRPRQRPEVHLDLTPLIDVVFLLLIFFMVSTTFDKQTQLQVDLPEASEQEYDKTPKDEIRIQIDRNGHFYVNEKELVTHDIETLMRAIRQEREQFKEKDLPIVVESDKQAPFQAAVMVMDAVGQLGLSRLSFAADQTESQ